jgi:BirA family biotin operon repressor/biotin-[acetyl-CoA-carboxylase] ligase
VLIQHKLLTADVVQPLLSGRFGRAYVWHASCASTQDLLRGSDLPEGAVAVTEHQTAGRGREGRRWEGTAGRSLLFSLLLRPTRGLSPQQLPLVAGLAVADAVEAATDAHGVAAIKWPNDVLVGGRKVAGILLESSGGSVVCGIGINVAQAEDELPAGARLPAASLLTAVGHAPDRAELLAVLLATLERRYAAWCRSGLAPLLVELEARNALRGKRVRVGAEAGVAGALAPDGRLTLARADGSTVLVGSGEVVEMQGRG